MSDEKKEIENEPFYKKKSFYESPYVIIVFVFILLVVFYYFFSPLQQCLRTESLFEGYCFKQLSW